MNPEIYYLPGRGGSLDSGLGAALQERGFTFTGRETLGHFQRLPFPSQIEAIAQDLRSSFWHQDARVIAHSFGAYLFWHAQAMLPPFPGRVLMLSPIIGSASTPDGRMRFHPPRAEVLMQLAERGELASPRECEMHVGELDWQCSNARLQEFCQRLRVPLAVVPHGGHLLDKGYVSAELDRWLLRARRLSSCLGR